MAKFAVWISFYAFSSGVCFFKAKNVVNFLIFGLMAILVTFNHFHMALCQSVIFFNLPFAPFAILRFTDFW